MSPSLPHRQFRRPSVQCVESPSIPDIGLALCVPFFGLSCNGRFLRHRPKRSERCLNYTTLHQG
ncbi:MAG: hypothetical protein CMM00_01605 [Rhodopirellula sp.]|nr:hypothetical protein [Rhodopirellula sp.]